MSDKAKKKNGNWERLASRANLFLNSRKSADSLSHILRQAAKLLKSAPQTLSASIYLLNEETYEFNHKATEPDKYAELAEPCFNRMIEDGAIGGMLQSGDIVEREKRLEEKCELSAVAIPLTVPWGALGIALLLREADADTIESPNVDYLKILGGLLGSTIENSMLLNNLNKTKELLEQKVAARTLSLAQSKRELDAIFDAVNAGIVVLDQTTNIVVKANQVGAEIIGDDEDNIVGSIIDKYFNLSNSELNGFDSKSSNNIETELRKADGTTLPVLRTVSQINLGNFKYKIISFLDISDRKKAEMALKKTNEYLELKVMERTEDLQLLVHKLKEEIAERERAENEIRIMLEKEKELNELKTRFISMVSHEFRTPLTIIRSSAQLVEKYYVKLSLEEKSEYLVRIMKTVDIMTDLMENVIFIGKTDVDKFNTEPSKINLATFLKTLIKDFQLTLRQKRNIVTKIDCDNKEAFIDGKLLRLVLVNLISNAVKYSGEDKPVEVFLDCEGAKAVFTIRDYGVGIPSEEQDKIFEVFFRAKNVGTIPGTGLGMSVVLRSLRMLNGTIDLSSKLGSGTTFKITTPISG